MRKENKLPKPENYDSQSGKNQHNLILYNDDINDFSYVIESLVEVCNHDSVQAEQCTYLAHYNGKCEVKTGSYAKLKQMKDSLIERGLQAEVQ
jgi:ATP-dependent Clp protease adaptor protein ClpS